MAQLENNNVSIDQRLEELIDQARTACSTNGAVSTECAVAWDAVEEVQAEISHRQAQPKSSLAQYCEERPDAAECRVYDV